MQGSYDVIVIGTGSAGMSAAESAVSAGAKVCVIERDRFGGECPNFACVPSKAVLHAAKLVRTAQEARTLGVEVDLKSLSFSKVMKYRQGVVEAITGGGEWGDRYVRVLAQLGIDTRLGAASFVDAKTIEVAGERLTAKAFVIATGTVDFIPPIQGVDTVAYWRWKEAVMATRQPKTMVVIGGGPVGCEIATMYASFGTRVTLLQGAPAVLHREDSEISQKARVALERLGIEVVTGAKVEEIVGARGGVTGVRTSEKMYAADKIVIATGKRPNSAGLNLEAAGVVLDKRGGFGTTKQQVTNVPHIFAAGDVDGGMQFTHTAHHEGWVAGRNAALKAKRSRKERAQSDMRVVPRVTFIAPEVASVGMTAAQVKEKYGSVLVGRFDLGSLGRSVTESARFGLVKLVAHPTTKKVLGGHIIGERAGELIHEVAFAMHVRAQVGKLASMMHAFPTFSEGVKAAAAMMRKE